MQYKRGVIIFDAMGVLYPFPEGDDVTYGIFAFLEENGYKFSKEEIQYWEKTYGYNQATRGLISSIEALRLLVPNISDYELERLEETYLTSNYFQLDTDFKTVIGLLKNDFIIAMLSNDIPDWSIRLRKRFELENYFDVFVISGDGNQARKPEKELYIQLVNAIDSRGHHPEKIYFIDDSLKNLRTAHEIGFSTVYRILKTNDYVDFVPDYKINRLSELVDIATPNRACS